METNQPIKPAKIDEIWYYIIVQEPGTSGEQIMAYEGKENVKPFIPAFRSKEEAQQCFLIMPKDVMKYKYEAQAIIQEDLLHYAEKAECSIFLMDDRGTLKEQIY